MTELNYGKMVESAMRGVVRSTLTDIAKNGIDPDKHHFYITLQSHFPGVALPDHLKQRYPDNITLVLQHQYFGLDVDDQKFSVTLSFNNIQERLVIPFDSIVEFTDPPAQFGLKFQPVEVPAANDEPVTVNCAEEVVSTEESKVISFADFRKKMGK